MPLSTEGLQSDADLPYLDLDTLFAQEDSAHTIDLFWELVK
jgi:hypothetical protein